MKKNNLVGLVIATSLGLSSLAGCVVSPAGALPGGAGAKPPATQPGSTTPGAVKPATTGQLGTPSKATAQPVGKVAATQAQSGAAASQETAAAMAEEREMEDYDALADEAAAGRYVLMLEGQPPAPDGMVAITGGAGLGVKDPVKGPRPPVRGVIRPGKDVGALGKEIGALNRGRGVKLTVDQKTKLRTEAKGLKADMAAYDDAKAAFKTRAAALEIDAEVKAKVETRRVKFRDQVKGRLDKLKDVRQKIKGELADAKWIDNGDGTSSVTLEFDVEKTIGGKTHIRKAKLVRTIDNETKVLVYASADFQQTLPSGLSRTSSRTKTLNEDGSYSVIFHSEVTLPKGGKRVAHWEKEISADGVVTGTGKIVWTDASGVERKTVTIALGGSEEEPVASASDESTNIEAEVTITDDGTVEATVAADGQTEEIEIDVAADGSVEVATSEDGNVTIEADGDIVVEDGEAEESSDDDAEDDKDDDADDDADDNEDDKIDDKPVDGDDQADDADDDSDDDDKDDDLAAGTVEAGATSLDDDDDEDKAAL